MYDSIYERTSPGRVAALIPYLMGICPHYTQSISITLRSLTIDESLRSRNEVSNSSVLICGELAVDESDSKLLIVNL